MLDILSGLAAYLHDLALCHHLVESVLRDLLLGCGVRTVQHVPHGTFVIRKVLHADFSPLRAPFGRSVFVSALRRHSLLRYSICYSIAIVLRRLVLTQRVHVIIILRLLRGVYAARRAAQHQSAHGSARPCHDGLLYKELHPRLPHRLRMAHALLLQLAGIAAERFCSLVGFCRKLTLVRAARLDL